MIDPDPKKPDEGDIVLSPEEYREAVLKRNAEEAADEDSEEDNNDISDLDGIEELIG